jgi:PAS domain S-box-containing protein
MNRFPLSIRLPAIVILAVVLTALAGTAAMFFTGRSSMQKSLETSTTEFVASYAKSIEIYLNDSITTLEGTAQEEAAANYVSASLFNPGIYGLPDSPDLPERKIASSILTRTTTFEYSMLLQPDGTIYLMQPYTLQTKLTTGSLSFANWYRQLIGTGESVISDLHISPATQSPTIVIATPVFDSAGKLYAIWAGGLNLSEISQIGRPLSSGNENEHVSYVTDSRGLIIAHTTTPKFVQEQSDFSSVPAVRAALSDQQGVIKYNDPISGREELSGYMMLPGIHWAVVHTMPLQVAMAPINNVQRTFSWMTIVLVVLAGGAGFGLLWPVIKSIRQMTAAAAIIGQGNLSHRVNVSGGDEIGQLGREFNQMAERLTNTLVSRDELAKEVDERKKTEEALRQSEEKYRNLFQNAAVGMYRSKLDGSAILAVNKKLCEIFGYGEDEMLGNPATIRWADLVERNRMITELRKSGSLSDFEMDIVTKSGQIRTCSVSVKLYPEQGYIEGSAIDITDRKHAEELLARSNMELQQFAQIISHDLQEPLRTISSYLQLLERRYKDKLDKDAGEFIGFAVEGSKRMQDMIGGLLEYSRVETRGKQFVSVKCEEVLQAVIDNLQLTIADSSAHITHDVLPVVNGDFNQLTQLFQNLIINGIKFRKLEQPHVHISALLKDREWVFSIRDNGIGIEPKYFDRLFRIFQRLHFREEYPGTGMGLAICKRIVERHGGRIWIESEFGKGSTFYFAIPIKGEG